MTEVKKTPCWMEGGRKTESGVPEVIMDGRHKGTRSNRLRFARKMGERKARKKENEKRDQRKQLTPWQKTKQEYKDKGVQMIKRPDMTSVQKSFGARRVG